MGPADKRAVAAPEAADYGLLAAEPELLEAMIEVYAGFELPTQLDRLLRFGLGSTGATVGFALGPGEDARTIAPVAASVPRDDPRWEWLTGIDREQAESVLGEGGLHEGLGLLTRLVEPRDEGCPGFSAVLPVRDRQDRQAGWLWLHFERRPGVEELAAVQRLIELVRPAVSNALQVLSMRELIIKDDTARCFNRRYFETCLPEELSRAGRFHAPLSLIFLDMDNLKEVNNRFGHAMGSRTLFEVSHRVRAKIRKFDKLFRFGGDEFCIVLPETEWHGALEVAERVRDSIAGTPFLLRHVDDPNGVRMTASLGIASYPLHARTAGALVEYADRAMQRIKSGTKNSIGIAEIVGDENGS